jgi:autotransporter-associated beta strand protein
MGSLTTAGILIYTGAGETTDRVINLAGTTGGATIENDGTGPLSFTSAFTATGSGVKTLTLQGVNAAPSTISAAIVNSASATALTKAQTGTWALSGVNTYTGATTVNGGTLLVNSPGSLASGSAVTVAAGATLGGNGTINGTVSVSAGGIVAPGGANSIGTLTLANSGNALTLNGALLLFDLDDPTTAGTTYDTITIGGTGVLVLNGANYIQFNAPLGSIPNGTYTLMTYSSTSGSGSLVLPNGSTTMTYGASTFTLTVTTTSVTLGVTGGSAPGALTWSGATSTAWNSTDGNWNEGSLTMQDYSDPDSVIFDDTAPANTTTVTGGAVNPGSVNFNNSVNTYSIGANIGGTGTPVWKFGTNTATLTGANTFTGPTTIGAGTLAIASAGDLGDNGSGSGSYAANIANAGTFIYNSSASQTLSGIISGSGSLTQKGSGTLTLSGVTNTYTGTTTIGNNSTLTVSGAGKLGSGSGAYAGAISIGTGGTLDYISTTYQTLSGVISGGGSVTLNSPVLTASPFNLTLSGTANTFSGGVTILDGILVANADLSLGAAPGSYNASYITLNGPSGTPYAAGLRTGSFTVNANRGIYLGANGGSIHCGSGSTLTYAGIISGPGSFWSGESVTVGYGTVKLSGANSYGGSTTVAAGTLQLGASGTLPSGTPVTIASDGSAGSVLDLNSFNQTIGPLSSSPGVGGTGTKTPTLKLSGALTINETSPTTFSGVISGTTGTLTLSASSTAALTLSGVNTFTGPININAGALTIGGPGGKLSSASTVNILNNGTFNFNSPVSQTLAGVISGSGPLIVNPGLAGGCILTLSGVNTYSGATTIANDGQVVISSESPTGGSLGTPPGSTVANQLTLNYGFLQVLNTMTLDVHRGITLGAGQIFNGAALGGAIFVDSGALTIPGVITGPSGIIFGGGTAQYGPGTVLLTGQNTYAGETGISTGTLQLGANGALPAGTPLIMAPDNYSGPTFDMNSVSQTIGPLSTIPLFAGPAGSGTPTILLSGPLTIIETSSTGFNGVINGSGGSLTLAAASTGTLTLSNANSYDGLTTISGGILEGNAAGSIPGNVTVNTGGKLQLDNINAMSSGATLTLPSSPAAGTVNLNLSGGTQTISALYFGATQQAIGTWGANGSGATYQNLAFTGSGILNVTTGPAITYSHTNYLQSITSNGGGSYTISALGTPGASYYLTYSANVQAPLSTWTPVPGSTNIAGGGGALSFTANNTPPAFYDVVAINPAP